MNNSHDLQFDVQHGDGTVMRPNEGPISMDHLPASSSSSSSMRMMDTSVGSDSKSKPMGSGSLEFIQNQLKQSSHPTVIIFHILFKAAALFFYIFGGWFVGRGNNAEKGARFISLTVVCILLLAADFWVVKNVTGRLLVGLRWWNKVEEDDTKWIFESAEGKRPVNPFDRTVFWTVLYGTPAIWTALLLLGIIKFALNWLLIVVMALALSGANVYGYYRCSKEQKAKFQQMMQQHAQNGAFSMVKSTLLTALTGNANFAAANNRNFV
jgi:hypothetical protein